MMSLFRISWNEVIIWYMIMRLKTYLMEKEIQKILEKEEKLREKHEKRKEMEMELEKEKESNNTTIIKTRERKNTKPEKFKNRVTMGRSTITTPDMKFFRRSHENKEDEEDGEEEGDGENNELRDGGRSRGDSLRLGSKDHVKNSDVDNSFNESSVLSSSGMSGDERNLDNGGELSTTSHRESESFDLYDEHFTLKSILEAEQDLIFLIYVVFFNNLIIPLVAVAAVSGRCFYYAIFAPPTVTSTYYYYECLVFTPIRIIQAAGCREYGLTSREVTYYPPFSYSYQCSSTILTKFASVYVYMGLFVGIILPVSRLICAAIYRYCHYYYPTTFHGSLWDSLLLKCLSLPLIPIDLLLKVATESAAAAAQEEEDHIMNPSLVSRPTELEVVNQRINTLNTTVTAVNNPIHEFSHYIHQQKQKELLERSSSSYNSNNRLTFSGLPNGPHRHSLAQHENSSQNNNNNRGKEGLTLQEDKETTGRPTTAKDIVSSPKRPSNSINSNVLPMIDGTIFNREKFIVKVTNYLAILITFGLIFPLLALILFFSLYLLTYYEQIILTNFMLNIKRLFTIKYSNSFRLHSKYVQHIFYRSLWILLSFATIIYAFLLFDTIGDVYGWRVGLLVAMGIMLWYGLVYFFFDRIWRNLRVWDEKRLVKRGASFQENVNNGNNRNQVTISTTTELTQISNRPTLSMLKEEEKKSARIEQQQDSKC
jgi:predicted  nucleic acid-binding Zn-ribbon protein